MDIGKINEDLLKRVLAYLDVHKGDLDSNVLEWDYRGDILITTNPALGVPIETLGFFAFHYSASNIAVSMGVPKYIINSVLLPPDASEEDLIIIFRTLGEECRKYNVKVIGGHTGVYYGLEIPLVNVTSIGLRVREKRSPLPGDHVLIIGRYGLETLWLASLGGYINSSYVKVWRELTPLPKALFALKREEAKLMHDVSEGGVIRGLMDIMEKYEVGLKVDFSGINIESLLYNVVGDSEIYSIPNYGMLIVIVEKSKSDEFMDECKRAGFECNNIGQVIEDKKLVVDGRLFMKFRRSSLDYLYGELQTLDPIINRLGSVLKRIESYPSIVKLIPEVGLNMVYGPEKILEIGEIAGLSGRVVKSLGRPKVCGKVIYGGSKHLSTVVYEAHKVDKNIRAGVNIAGNEITYRALVKLGIKVKKIEGYISSRCPIADFIKENREIYEAYYHVGSHGIEPMIVLLGNNPEKLLKILVDVAKYVDKKNS